VEKNKMSTAISITAPVFPFGEPLRVVAQQDRTPKKVFVLGVYASAVHAKWVFPEGRPLDELYLSPLGYSRNEAWLCALVPYSYQNPKQANAIKRAYDPVKAAHNLPDVTIPKPPAPLADFKPGRYAAPNDPIDGTAPSFAEHARGKVLF
jgi:hypothetical protein